MKKKKQHGGARPGAGRKPFFEEAMERYTLTLPPGYAEAARTVDPNLSAAVRRLIEKAGLVEAT